MGTDTSSAASPPRRPVFASDGTPLRTTPGGDRQRARDVYIRYISNARAQLEKTYSMDSNAGAQEARRLLDQAANLEGIDLLTNAEVAQINDVQFELARQLETFLSFTFADANNSRRIHACLGEENTAGNSPNRQHFFGLYKVDLFDSMERDPGVQRVEFYDHQSGKTYEIQVTTEEVERARQKIVAQNQVYLQLSTKVNGKTVYMFRGSTGKLVMEGLERQTVDPVFEVQAKVVELAPQEVKRRLSERLQNEIRMAAFRFPDRKPNSDFTMRMIGIFRFCGNFITPSNRQRINRILREAGTHPCTNGGDLVAGEGCGPGPRTRPGNIPQAGET